MNFDEQTYQRIQRYLDAEMDAAEAAAFEAEVNANPELAREVQLNVEMEQLLAETEENELRKSLQELKVQFANQDKEDNNNDDDGGYWRFLLLLIPLFLIGFWQWNSTESLDNQLAKIEEEAGEITNVDSVQTEGVTIDSTQNSAPIDNLSTTKNETTDPPTDELKSPEADPPSVELKIKTPPRENLRIEPITPQIDTTIQRDSTKIYAEDELEPIIEIQEPILYSNIETPGSVIETPVFTTMLLDSLVQQNANQTYVQLTDVELPAISVQLDYTLETIITDTFTFAFSAQVHARGALPDLQYQVFANDQLYAERKSFFEGLVPLVAIENQQDRSPRDRGSELASDVTSLQSYSFAIERKLPLTDYPIELQNYYVLISAPINDRILWAEELWLQGVAIADLTNYLYSWDNIVAASSDPNAFQDSKLHVPNTIMLPADDSTTVFPIVGETYIRPTIYNETVWYGIFADDNTQTDDSRPILQGKIPTIPNGDRNFLYKGRERLVLNVGTYYLVIKDGEGRMIGAKKFQVVGQ